MIRTSRQTTALCAALAVAGALHAAAPTANVVFLDGAIDGASRPRVLASDNVEGYVTAVGPYDGSSVTVQRMLAEPSTGFDPTTPLEVDVALPPPPGQYVVVGNQMEPDRALAWFGEPGVYDPLGVELDPAPGSYETSVRVRFRTRLAGTTVNYSIDAGPTVAWDGEPFYIVDNAAIQFQGVNGDVGPQKVGVYSVTFPDCADVDQDELPDRIEAQIGLDPLVAERDFNRNRRDDFDEFIRGAAAFVADDPDYEAPLFADGDGDTWSDYDEQLRDTNPADADEFPAAPNVQTVEIRRAGDVYELGPGGTPPPNSPDPAKPYPEDFRVDVVTPGGASARPGVETNGEFILRTSGEQFRYLRARALDGSGRMLLSVQPPVGLCVDATQFCTEADSPDDWRDEWRTAYEVAVFDDAIDQRIDPRTTAEALLLNRYYELAAGQAFVPGEENRGPDQDLVLALRAGRNEAALYQVLYFGVETEMIDLVADYYKFHASPGRRSMMALLADHFAGRPVDPEDVPDGVRLENIASVAMLVDAFFLDIVPPARTELTGEIAVDAFGFTLDDGSDVYRLEKLADSFLPGTTLTVEAIVDIDNCGFAPIPARVTQVLDRTFAEVASATDSDGDQMDDDWEYFYFGDLDEEALGDADGDGLTNIQEFNMGTSPLFSQTLQNNADGDLWMIR